MNESTGALLIGLLIGLLLGVGFAALLFRSKKEQAPAAATEGALEELRSQLLDERKKSEATITLTAELKTMKERVEDLGRLSLDADRRRVGAEAEIKTQILQMASHNENLVNQTRAIAGALASSQTRGKFGEAHLEQLLEGAGLIEGEHFTRQRSAEKSGTSGAIPDITIHVPGGSVIYIDSKFPFERFYEAFETQDPQERASLIAAHTKDLMKHVEALSKRKYSERGASPDFVVLYAPVESIFTEALKSDPTLLNRAFALDITIATPTSMMALLRTVGYLFSRNRVASSAAEIQELAGKFLKDVSSLHAKIITVGDRLGSTLKAYNEMIPTAESTVLSAAKKMRNLEVPGKALKAIPELPGKVRQLHSKIATAEDDYIDGEEIAGEEIAGEEIAGEEIAGEEIAGDEIESASALALELEEDE